MIKKSKLHAQLQITFRARLSDIKDQIKPQPLAPNLPAAQLKTMKFYQTSSLRLAHICLDHFQIQVEKAQLTFVQMPSAQYLSELAFKMVLLNGWVKASPIWE